MVPILNHSLFININSKIINVIIEIVNAIGLLNTILLYSTTTFLISLLDLSLSSLNPDISAPASAQCAELPNKLCSGL